MNHARTNGLFKEWIHLESHKYHRSLTTEQVKEVISIKLKNPKISNEELGSKYNLSGKNIGCIIRGKTYKHIKR